MEKLCFLTNVSGEQWAAWAQAFLSFGAIVWAAILSRRQFKDAQLLQAQERHAERLAKAENIQTLGQIATNVIAYTATELRDRQNFALIQSGGKHFDLDAMTDVERQINALPVHDLSVELVPYVFMVGGTVRQLRQLAERALSIPYPINDVEFDKMVESVTGLQLSLHRTNADIVAVVGKIRSSGPLGS